MRLGVVRGGKQRRFRARAERLASDRTYSHLLSKRGGGDKERQEQGCQGPRAKGAPLLDSVLLDNY